LGSFGSGGGGADKPFAERRAMIWERGDSRRSGVGRGGGATSAVVCARKNANMWAVGFAVEATEDDSFRKKVGCGGVVGWFSEACNRVETGDVDRDRAIGEGGAEVEKGHPLVLVFIMAPAFVWPRTHSCGCGSIGYLAAPLVQIMLVIIRLVAAGRTATPCSSGDIQSVSLF